MRWGSHGQVCVWPRASIILLLNTASDINVSLYRDHKYAASEYVAASVFSG